MKLKNKLNQKRILRERRIRAKIKGKNNRPRLSIFRSNQYIYVQLINDETGKTIVSASSQGLKKMKPIDVAKEVGSLIAKKAIEAGFDSIVFDRGRFSYHGVVKALAESARASGLKF